MPEYGEIDYWDNRYETNCSAYDWYVGWSDIKACPGLQGVLELWGAKLVPVDSTSNDIGEGVKQKPRCLVIGTGNSPQAEEMAKEGWEVFAIDYSSIVIEHMKKIGEHGVAYIEMDARKLSFDDDFFDFVIDKGTLDAILCGKNSTENARNMIRNIYRVLKSGGHFMCVTYGRPDARVVHIQQPGTDWEVDHFMIDKPIAEDNPNEDMATQYHAYLAGKNKVLTEARPESNEPVQTAEHDPAPHVETPNVSDAEWP